MIIKKIDYQMLKQDSNFISTDFYKIPTDVFILIEELFNSNIDKNISNFQFIKDNIITPFINKVNTE